MSEQPRLSVNMNAETAEALREYARENNVSYTEAVRRAVGVLKFFADETKADRRILTAKHDGTDLRDVVMF